MDDKIEKLKIYKDAIEELYNNGYCKGIISKKKIRILVGILSNEIKKEQKTLIYVKGEEK